MLVGNFYDLVESPMLLNHPYKKLSLSVMLAMCLTACGSDDKKSNPTPATPTPEVPAEPEQPTTPVVPETPAPVIPETPVVPETPELKADFRVKPYLQNPASDAMTIVWFSESSQAGDLTIEGMGSFKSQPVQAVDLHYTDSEVTYIHDKTKNLGEIHPNAEAGKAPTLPYRHLVRVTGLKSNQSYSYTVNQAGDVFKSEFKTAPKLGDKEKVKFVVMSDMETEPESTQKKVRWAASALKIDGGKLYTDPASQTRDYLVDQTVGYKQTLNYAAKMQPDFWLIAGDLVEKGGRQLDWDEFWRHSAGEWGTLASRTPILPALGNHENYWQPVGNTYGPGAVKRSYDKWRTYFDLPSNYASNESYNKRYYRMDYGPVTIITLDSSNGDDTDKSRDTNLYIDGKASNVPDFNEGSEQWQWAVSQLADARAKGQVIFVQWHHMAYGTGVHSLVSGSAGIANNEDEQSGLPMRVYHQLMKDYGVTAVFSGHNELLETVELDGVHYWDVGIAGDGLRGPGYFPTTSYVPFELLPKAAQQTHWSAHGDSQEMWVGNRLVEGGKHYGFVQVEVTPLTAINSYDIVIRPRYSLPVVDQMGVFLGQFEERSYSKEIRVKKKF